MTSVPVTVLLKSFPKISLGSFDGCVVSVIGGVSVGVGVAGVFVVILQETSRSEARSVRVRVYFIEALGYEMEKTS